MQVRVRVFGVAGAQACGACGLTASLAVIFMGKVNDEGGDGDFSRQRVVDMRSAGKM